MISEGSCDTEDWMMLKIQLCITGINYILKYIQIENIFFVIIVIVIILYNITEFTVYLKKKMV